MSRLKVERDTGKNVTTARVWISCRASPAGPLTQSNSHVQFNIFPSPVPRAADVTITSYGVWIVKQLRRAWTTAVLNASVSISSAAFESRNERFWVRPWWLTPFDRFDRIDDVLFNGTPVRSRLTATKRIPTIETGNNWPYGISR